MIQILPRRLPYTFSMFLIFCYLLRNVNQTAFIWKLLQFDLRAGNSKAINYLSLELTLENIFVVNLLSFYGISVI